ncbi:hypothetical protein [Natronosalvus halobius]|nr:hypothetical protein [Natronosalvus halobius]
MLETVGIVLFVLVVGFVLFLPSIAISWWQSRERDDDHEERESR